MAVAENATTTPTSPESSTPKRPKEYADWLAKYKLADTDKRFAEWQKKQETKSTQESAKNAPAAAPQESDATAPAKAAKPARRKEGAPAAKQKPASAALFDSPELDADIPKSVRTALSAIARGDGHGVIHNEKYGDIQYPLGRTGKGGFGLMHIVEQRMWKDGATLEGAVDTAVRVGVAAEVGTETAHVLNTRHFDHGGVRAIVAMDGRHNPIITGYEIDADETAAARRRAAELAPRPHVSSEEVIAQLERRIARNGAEVNGSPEAGEHAEYGADFDSPELDPARREYGEVVARYTNPDGTRRAGWMKAPNGKPTNLTERQWAQVRTPSFKKWFGDWEAAATLSAIERMTSVEITDLADGFDTKAAYSALANGKNALDDREVRFVSATLGKILRHRGYDTARLVPRLKEVFDAAIPLGFETERTMPARGDGTPHKEHRNFVGYHSYLGKITDGGRTYFVRFTVQELKTRSKSFIPNELHSTFVSDVELYNEADLLALDTAKGAGKVGAVGLIDGILAKSLSEFKRARDGSSKVVDENGEPLVVYHGTSDVFTEFKPEEMRAREGSFFFAENREDAMSYSGNGNVMPVYVNLRNPFDYERGSVPDTYRERWRKAETKREQVAILKELGYDGWLADFENGNGWGEVSGFYPEQVKSATDNVGAFSQANPDIRFDSPELDFGTASDKASETLGGLKEMRTVAIRRTANSYAEARAALAPQVGKVFQNKESGVTATLSNNSVNKLLSGKAVAKSVGVKEHLTAVANVTELFENGKLLETDDGTRKGVLAAKRFYTRFTHNGEDLVAKTTVLEYEHGDHRIYSVEAMEVEKAGSILAPKGSLNQAESPALPLTPPIVPQSGAERGTRFAVTPAEDAAKAEFGANFDSPELDPARREYGEVVARYTNPDGTRRAGWMKAPNGKPTNLTERQWAQVRTPSFKKWFGDWEAVATSDAILGDEDIRSDGKLLTVQGKEQREAAKALYNELRDKSPVETSDGRTVLFSTTGFKEIKSHSADPHTLAIVPILREVIETAHYIGDGEKKSWPAAR